MPRNTLRQQMGDQVVVDDDYCFAGFDGYKHVIAASTWSSLPTPPVPPLHAMTAIKAGRHVFVEKPHGIDPAGIKVMQAAARLAEEKGLCLVSGLKPLSRRLRRRRSLTTTRNRR